MKTMILPDKTALANAAAEMFLAQAQASIQARGRFAVALAGGSTPRGLYARLAQPDYASRLDWEAVHLFWGDERCVPPDHPDSNYRMARESLQVPLPEENIHRIHGELLPEAAAETYAGDLRAFFGDTPRFDLILLGMGTDGHTASLFPESPALHERTRWVVSVPHETPPPPLVPRVTLTLPILNAARQIVFLVAGADKAERLAEVLRAPRASTGLPASMIRPADGELLWLIDQPAATHITANRFR
ncbi:MAG: 6-phosphogluconolactonase [Anaerolineales bacterium]